MCWPARDATIWAVRIWGGAPPVPGPPETPPAVFGGSSTRPSVAGASRPGRDVSAPDAVGLGYCARHDLVKDETLAPVRHCQATKPFGGLLRLSSVLM